MSTKRRRRRSKFLPFEQARELVRKLPISSKTEWARYWASGKRPPDIPADPSKAYADSGWRGWGDWFGTFKKSPTETARQKRPFDEAVTFARSLDLASRSDWYDWKKQPGNQPSDIPAAPDVAYKNEGWRGWPHFLGTDNKAPGTAVYRDFTSARAWAQSQEKARTQKEWNALSKSGGLPPGIPANPAQMYRDKGWISWPDWLDTDPRNTTRKRTFKPYPDARNYARTLGLERKKDWEAFAVSVQLPLDIPVDQSDYYKGSGWTTWGDFLEPDWKLHLVISVGYHSSDLLNRRISMS